MHSDRRERHEDNRCMARIALRSSNSGPPGHGSLGQSPRGSYRTHQRYRSRAPFGDGGTGHRRIGAACLAIDAQNAPDTSPENDAENVGDINDQPGDRAATAAARNGVTSSQAIEFARGLGDTMISRVTSKKRPVRTNH